MKRTILIILAIAALGASSQAQRFAYVNTEYILENIPEYEQAQEQLDAIAAKWQKEIEDRYNEIGKLYPAYQAEQVLLTEAMQISKAKVWLRGGVV